MLAVEVVGLQLSGLEGGTLRGKGDDGAGEEAKEGGAEAKKWSMRALCFWAGLGGGAAEVVVNVVDVVVVLVVVVVVVVEVVEVVVVVAEPEEVGVEEDNLGKNEVSKRDILKNRRVPGGAD